MYWNKGETMESISVLKLLLYTNAIPSYISWWPYVSVHLDGSYHSEKKSTQWWNVDNCEHQMCKQEQFHRSNHHRNILKSSIGIVSTFYHQAIYERLFCWIVGKINSAIEVKGTALEHGKNTVIGVLDIYGFEIFDDNRWVWRMV